MLDNSASFDGNEDYLNYADENDDMPGPNNQLKLLKMDLAKIDQQTLESKRELEQWRHEAKALENMLKKPNTNMEMLSDIQSEIRSRRDESVKINSNLV